MALLRSYGSIDNPSTWLCHWPVVVPLNFTDRIMNSVVLGKGSHFAGFNCRKLLEVNLSTPELCACKVDTVDARVRMSSACR